MLLTRPSGILSPRIQTASGWYGLKIPLAKRVETCFLSMSIFNRVLEIVKWTDATSRTFFDAPLRFDRLPDKMDLHEKGVVVGQVVVVLQPTPSNRLWAGRLLDHGLRVDGSCKLVG